MRLLCSLLIVLPKLDFFYALTSKQARQPLTRPQQYNYSLQLHQGHETHTYVHIPRDYGMAFKHRPPKSYNKPFLYQREEEEESPTQRLVVEVASKTASEAFHYYMVCMWRTGWPQNSNMNEETAAQHPHEEEEEETMSSTTVSLRGHHRGQGCTTMLCVYPRSESKQAGFCAPLTILMLPKYRLVAQH